MRIEKLSSGYYRLRGDGLCEWAQPPFWPCDEKTLREHAFPEASEKFIHMLCEQNEMYRSEGSHLFKRSTDEFGRVSFIHCYQDPRIRGIKKLAAAYEAALAEE